MPTDFETGLLVGLLIGEGHFGGDGRQPQVTLRMHVRHASLFRWLERTFPGGKLYGPYSHGGRDYYQWMARGRYLRDYLIPLLAQRLDPEVDGPSFERFDAMRRRYVPGPAGRPEEVSVAPGGSGAPERPLPSTGAAIPAEQTGGAPVPPKTTAAPLVASGVTGLTPAPTGGTAGRGEAAPAPRSSTAAGELDRSARASEAFRRLRAAGLADRPPDAGSSDGADGP
jgi:hypothetical protein